MFIVSIKIYLIVKSILAILFYLKIEIFYFPKNKKKLYISESRPNTYIYYKHHKNFLQQKIILNKRISFKIKY